MKAFIKTMLLLIVLVITSTSGLKAQSISGVITSNPQSLSFETEFGYRQTKTVKISVINLNILNTVAGAGLLRAKISGTDYNQFYFHQNSGKILLSLGDLINGKPTTIDVTYDPQNAGSHNANLLIVIPVGVGLDLILCVVPLTGKTL